ncbi:MAG: hypothetical protein KAU48_00085 [Candidatus Thorarchaeota archaeon]|nr:hypothetical protein [Candidatus Thorarchaeota archaeon]
MEDENIEYGESYSKYLITGGAISTFLESLYACLSILFLVSDIFLNPYGSDWGPWFTNYTATLFYFSLSLVGFAIGLYVLRKFNRDLDMQESIRISMSKMILTLNTPFFFVAIIVGTLISVIQPSLTLLRGVLLYYGFGLGLLFARVLYYIYESRTWIVTPIFPAKATQKRRRVLGYLISSQIS